MEAIRQTIIYSLPSYYKVSRKKSVEAYRMTFRSNGIHWLLSRSKSIERN